MPLCSHKPFLPVALIQAGYFNAFSAAGMDKSIVRDINPDMIDSFFLCIAEKNEIPGLHIPFIYFFQIGDSELGHGTVGQFNTEDLIIDQPDKAGTIQASCCGPPSAIGDADKLFQSVFKLLIRQADGGYGRRSGIGFHAKSNGSGHDDNQAINKPGTSFPKKKVEPFVHFFPSVCVCSYETEFCRSVFLPLLRKKINSFSVPSFALSLMIKGIRLLLTVNTSCFMGK